MRPNVVQIFSKHYSKRIFNGTRNAWARHGGPLYNPQMIYSLNNWLQQSTLPSGSMGWEKVMFHCAAPNFTSLGKVIGVRWYSINLLRLLFHPPPLNTVFLSSSASVISAAQLLYKLGSILFSISVAVWTQGHTKVSHTLREWHPHSFGSTFNVRLHVTT